jgi:hypothetical protein
MRGFGAIGCCETEGTAALVGAAAIGGAACDVVAGGAGLGVGGAGLAACAVAGGAAGDCVAGRADGIATGATAVGAAGVTADAFALGVAAGFAAGGITTLGDGAVTGAFATGAVVGAGVFVDSAGGCDTAARLAGAVVPGCCRVMAFSTSPGLEIRDRSILVLISSASPRELRDGLEEEVWASAAARKRARTFTASCSSMELECVFFSVTPTSSRTSRIALLLTSSSLARSLIRILVIRSFSPPPCPAKSSCQPHGVSL